MSWTHYLEADKKTQPKNMKIDFKTKMIAFDVLHLLQTHLTHQKWAEEPEPRG